MITLAIDDQPNCSLGSRTNDNGHLGKSLSNIWNLAKKEKQATEKYHLDIDPLAACSSILPFHDDCEH